MKVYRDKDLEANLLEEAKVAVIGYGKQGRPHALNLRDSGIDVIVGAREGGNGWKRAAEDGFRPASIGEAAAQADFVSILLPDEVQPEVFKKEIGKNLKPGARLSFAHGFTVAFGRIELPPFHDVILVAPKGQGRALRKLYTEGKGLPCLVAVEVDASGEALGQALSYARSIGCLRAGAIEGSFKEEAVTDLFGEQVVLCGGVPELIKSAFNTLVEKGYQPEVAYIECLHELKIITDLMQEGGISYMRSLISKTAAWGSFTTGRSLVTDATEARMREILDFIESGKFAEEWMAEAESGGERFKEFLERERVHPIEDAGKAARSLMPYLKPEEK